MPVLNGSAPAQQSINMALGGAPTAIAAPILPAQVMTSMVPEPIGNPSECLLLKNMFDPSTEVCIIFVILLFHLYTAFLRPCL